MYGNIFKISRFCTDDGPGIRTTVFLKGCPLSCKWCHNPESQNFNFELFFDRKKCVNCGKCAKICPKGLHIIDEKGHYFERIECDGCGNCVSVCKTGALELVGKRISVEEVLREIKKDCVFYQTSGGGITISGGEPLFQPDFTESILRKCREENIRTAIETSGFSSEENFLKVINQCDLVLFDIKDTDEKRHLKNVGVCISPILKNLEILGKSKIPFLIRAPIIPSINDNKEHLLKLKEISSRWENCQGVEIMPYHSLGDYKYSLLNRKCSCKNVLEPKREEVLNWEKY